MNKDQDSNDAIEELKVKGEITIIEKLEEEREFEKIIEKSQTRQDYITNMQNNGYSEFMIGACIAFQLMAREKEGIKLTSTWNKMKSALTPAFMRK